MTIDDASEFHLPLPHRPPFLFVDEVTEETETSIKATKKFTGEEDFFKGHYPNYPILPGVIACESIFQTGAILLINQFQNDHDDKIPVLTRITKAKFKEQIIPPAALEISVSFKEKVMFAFFMRGNIRCNGKLAVEVEFTVGLVDSEKK